MSPEVEDRPPDRPDWPEELIAPRGDGAAFLKRRWAHAIERHDVSTIRRLRAQLDCLMNGRPAAAARTVAPERPSAA